MEEPSEPWRGWGGTKTGSVYERKRGVRYHSFENWRRKEDGVDWDQVGRMSIVFFWKILTWGQSTEDINDCKVLQILNKGTVLQKDKTDKSVVLGCVRVCVCVVGGLLTLLYKYIMKKKDTFIKDYKR